MPLKEYLDKKYIIILACILGLYILLSIVTPMFTNKSERVTKNCLDAIIDKDKNELNDLLYVENESSKNKIIESLIDEDIKFKYSIISSSEQKNTAIVNVEIKINNQKNKIKVYLIKNNKSWLVDGKKTFVTNINRR